MKPEKPISIQVLFRLESGIDIPVYCDDIQCIGNKNECALIFHALPDMDAFSICKVSDIREINICYDFFTKIKFKPI